MGKLCSGAQLLVRANFEQRLARGFDQTLSQENLTRLWQTVSESSAAQYLMFCQFCKHFCPGAQEEWAPHLPNGKQLAAYLHRLGRRLKAHAATVQQAFGPYDTTR